MLWANPRTKLPLNINVARKRFGFIKKRLRADSELNKKCQAVVKGYLEADPPYARKMSHEEAEAFGPRTWYCPTHPVVNINKPGKVRLVNDAAAEFGGVSLNKELVTGPDLLKPLVGVLIRFRTGKVAVAGDIEAMFHQVRVSPEDADSLRFLWQEDITSNEPPVTMQMLVHIFGAKDSPTCANYALQRTARDNFQDFDPLTYYTAIRSFYVDDLLKSVESDAVAINLVKQLVEMLKRRGFRLCKFASNHPAVLETLPEEDVSTSTTLTIDTEENLQRALGILWDAKKDDFTFNPQFKEEKATKRGILKTTSSVFDPLGFLIPFLLLAKLLLQELWRLGTGWDEQINDAMKVRWEKWLKSSVKLSSIRIKRLYVDPEDRRTTEIQLHVFCDASELAFGAAAYVRYSFKNGEHECALVMAKSRLAPIKTVSLPRLELDSARCGARLARLVAHELDLPIERIVYWSDSTLTLQYIKNKRHRMKSRVANRVTEILETSDAEDWMHVPGKDNPADILTRGVSDPTKLMSNGWFSGAKFLEQGEEEWPKGVVDELDWEDAEVKKTPFFTGMALIEVEHINWLKISSWIRLLRVAAWVLRFVDLLRGEEEKRLDSTLSTKEVEAAEVVVLKDVQRTAFPNELCAIQGEQPVGKSSQLSGLCPFIDSTGIIRIGGRLRQLDMKPEAKHPIILPRKHHVTKVLVEHYHRRNGHVGAEHVLSLVREKYWIIGGRIIMNQVVSQCFFCRVRRAKRQFPYMADLPKCRAAVDQPPFSHCGCDLFGPVQIKQGRKKLKRWVVLFTCLTVRSIHLEVVQSCDTDSFISAVRRFTNRRGCPTDIYSDNGTNFKGACNELKEFVTNLDKKRITDFASTFHINWHFNPPAAPHMGGAWERLVRSTKEVMYGLVKNHVLTDPQLITWLTEVEHILNSRPLTHLSEDINDLEALTPNHILLGRHRNWTSIADISEADVSSRKKWRQVQALQATFWSRWVKEYLPTLTKRPCWRDQKPNYRVGELVLVQDEDSKRGKWPLGRIIKVMPGRDGVVRTIEVKTTTGTYSRPAAKIFKLEDTPEHVTALE